MFGGLLMLAGLCIAAALIIGSVAINRYTSTDKFCTSCHAMASLAADPHYVQSPHRANGEGVRAGCGDCHIPHGSWFAETYAHAMDGGRALRESWSDEKREHSDAIARIQAEWDRLQKRIDAMYVDKLDGRIDEGFYKRTRAQWRDAQERCERDIERHRVADDSYMDQGIQLLDLAQNAHQLFMVLPAKEAETAEFSTFELHMAARHIRRRVQRTL